MQLCMPQALSPFLFGLWQAQSCGHACVPHLGRLHDGVPCSGIDIPGWQLSEIIVLSRQLDTIGLTPPNAASAFFRQPCVRWRARSRAACTRIRSPGCWSGQRPWCNCVASLGSAGICAPVGPATFQKARGMQHRLFWMRSFGCAEHPDDSSTCRARCCSRWQHAMTTGELPTGFTRYRWPSARAEFSCAAPKGTCRTGGRWGAQNSRHSPQKHL
jgi:hypothetical protein